MESFDPNANSSWLTCVWLNAQVALGCNYLKNTLKYQFPEVASRAAAVAVRQTAAANGAFARIRDNFDAGMADMTSTLQQLVRSCNDIHNWNTYLETCVRTLEN